MRRTQIYFSPEQWECLSAEATREGVTASELIRRAVDEYLERGTSFQARKQAALQRLRARPRRFDPTSETGAERVEKMRKAEWGRAEWLEAYKNRSLP